MGALPVCARELHAGRELLPRGDAGGPRPLRERRLQLAGDHLRPRGRPRPGRVDRRGSPGVRRLGGRRRPVRTVAVQPAVPARAHARGPGAPLRAPLAVPSALDRPRRAPNAAVRAAGAGERVLRRGRRVGAGELVRASGGRIRPTSTPSAGRTGSTPRGRSTGPRARRSPSSISRASPSSRSWGRERSASSSECARRTSTSDVGRIVYTLMLNHRGGIELDGTVTRLAEDRFLVVTPTVTQRAAYHRLRRAAAEAPQRRERLRCHIRMGDACGDGTAEPRAPHPDLPGRPVERRPSVGTGARDRGRPTRSPAPCASRSSASWGGSCTSRASSRSTSTTRS